MAKPNQPSSLPNGEDRSTTMTATTTAHTFAGRTILASAEDMTAILAYLEEVKQKAATEATQAAAQANARATGGDLRNLVRDLATASRNQLDSITVLSGRMDTMGTELGEIKATLGQINALLSAPPSAAGTTALPPQRETNTQQGPIRLIRIFDQRTGNITWGAQPQTGYAQRMYLGDTVGEVDVWVVGSAAPQLGAGSGSGSSSGSSSSGGQRAIVYWDTDGELHHGYQSIGQGNSHSAGPQLPAAGQISWTTGTTPQGGFAKGVAKGVAKVGKMGVYAAVGAAAGSMLMPGVGIIVGGVVGGGAGGVIDFVSGGLDALAA